MNLDNLINEALGEVKVASGVTPLQVFAKAAARGYIDTLNEKIAAAEQGSDEEVGGSEFLENTMDPANEAETVVQEMLNEANTALMEDGASHTEEGASAFSGEDRVASETFERMFKVAFLEELDKLANTGEATDEAVVNDAASSAMNLDALSEGTEEIDPEELENQIAEEILKREAPGYGGTESPR